MCKKYGKEGKYHVFLSELFCLTVPKNFVEKPFSFSKISGKRISMHRRGGGEVKVFSNFFLTVPKKFVGVPSYFRNVLVWKKTSWITRRVSRFPSEIF